jgi:hypothetical protein
MKLSNIAALASGATLVISQPLEKRVLVVETVYENVVETVDVYTTIWVKAGEVGATASVTPQVNTAAIDQESSTSVAASAPVSTPPAVVDQPKPSPYKRPQRLRHKHRSKSSSQKPVATPAPVVISTVIPTPEPTPIPEPVFTPAPVSTPAVEVPPPVEENPAKAENNQPAPPVVQDSQPPSYGAQVAPADKPKEANTANSGGACGTVGGQCSGELTFFEAGRGACGWINDGETEDVFALAHEMMGTQSNGNPYCGRTATVTVGDKSVKVKLVDKCMGCKGQDIDLSHHAIDQLMPRETGRLYGIKWHFND